MTCTLDGPAAASRYDAWHALLRGRAHRPVTSGWAVDLPIQDARTLVDLVLAEQECCPFLSFTISFAPAAVHLTGTAPDEGLTTLQALLPAPPA